MTLIEFCFNLIVWGVVLMVLLLAIEHGLFDRFESIRQLKRIATTAFKIADIWLTSQQKQPKVNVAKNGSNLSMSISYTIGGKEALINVPYNKEKAAHMRMWRVFLVRDRGNPIPITQPTGIPYLCSARMLGGKQIMACHKLDDTKIKSFDLNVKPMWLEMKTSDS